MKALDRHLVIAVVPAFLIGALFEFFLGHRHDYTGHYAAGYGGSLGALMVWLKGLNHDRYLRTGLRGIVPVVVVCILIGFFAEATAFRIAKLDEVDFWNQSLGAVLAGLVSVAFVTDSRPKDKTFDQGVIVAVAFFSLGGVFAVL